MSYAKPTKDDPFRIFIESQYGFQMIENIISFWLSEWASTKKRKDSIKLRKVMMRRIRLLNMLNNMLFIPEDITEIFEEIKTRSGYDSMLPSIDTNPMNQINILLNSIKNNLKASYFDKFRIINDAESIAMVEVVDNILEDAAFVQKYFLKLV